MQGSLAEPRSSQQRSGKKDPAPTSSVGPQGRACHGKRSKKQEPFHSCGSCQSGSKHWGPHLGNEEVSLPVWAVTVPKLEGPSCAHYCHPGLSLLVPASRKPAWARPEVREAQSSGLHPHQAPVLGFVPPYSLGWMLQGQGWALYSWKTPSTTWPVWVSVPGCRMGAKATLDMP